MADELFKIVGQAPDPADGRSTVEIECYVQPGAGRACVVGRRHGALHLRVAPPPQDDRANLAVEAFLADLLDVPRSAVSVVAGQRARQKRVRVTEVSLDRLRATIAGATETPRPRSGGSEGRIRPGH